MKQRFALTKGLPTAIRQAELLKDVSQCIAVLLHPISVNVFHFTVLGVQVSAFRLTSLLFHTNISLQQMVEVSGSC